LGWDSQRYDSGLSQALQVRWIDLYFDPGLAGTDENRWKGHQAIVHQDRDAARAQGPPQERYRQYIRQLSPEQAGRL
jgi:hypothetical protein